MELAEGIRTGLDTVAAAVTLSWSVLASLADTGFDLLSGKRPPEPDLKSVAEAPEPGELSRARPPRTLPRPSRSTIRNHAA